LGFFRLQAAHAYIRGHQGKRHLPTLLRLVTEAISKIPQNRQAKAAGTSVGFAGFTRESASVVFTSN